jgi:hypothetical protein
VVDSAGVVAGVRRAAKVDGNHVEIVDALRAAGFSVESLARVGGGCPDLLVGAFGANVLIEVKVPGERLNALQKPWHTGWKGVAHIATSALEAIQIAASYRKR